LVKFHGKKKLDLGWLISIDKETATELAKFNGGLLELNWLTNIDKEVAIELDRLWNKVSYKKEEII
jgi:hypothetical protein